MSIGLSLALITAGVFWASQRKRTEAPQSSGTPALAPSEVSPQALAPVQPPAEAHAPEGKQQPVAALPSAPATQEQPRKPDFQADSSGCFEMTFRHRKLPTHADAESCHRHKNRLKLAHALKDLHGICVRVDGDAVAFEKIKGAENDILLAGIAGPDSVIQVSYCKGTAKCSAECKIQPRKDAFLEAVGGVNDEKDSGEIAEWDADGASEADRKAVREVASEIQALDEDLKSEKDEDSVEFSGWEGGAENASSCELHKQAQKESPRG